MEQFIDTPEIIAISKLTILQTVMFQVVPFVQYVENIGQFSMISMGNYHTIHTFFLFIF